MSIAACAELVERGDSDRFAAVMAAPVTARKVLFPIHAFALEVARAPWVTEEPLIAEMRLQWWIDALDEIAEGAQPRRHEVVTPLADAVGAGGAKRLRAAVEARQWDIYRDPFENAADLRRYLEATAGAPLAVAALALGTEASAVPALMRYGAAVGLARFLQAVPALEARGRIPLVDGRPKAVADLAREGLGWLAGGYALRLSLNLVGGAPLLEGWQTAPLLRQVVREPTRVAAGALGLSPFHRSLRLVLMGQLRRWGAPKLA